ncbi:MAG: 3-deoxy-manno-octulosonate cytidylyltransferase [Chitinophagaceae bacterium]
MIAAIIPARFSSTRFPGKPLALIEGKTMIRRVYEQAVQSQLIDEVVVATDDQRIVDEVRSFGGHVQLTRADHPSGTDRCFEAVQLLDKSYDYVINIQGDEPFLDPRQIDELAQYLKQHPVEIATQMIEVASEAELVDPGEVKIVLNDRHEALYFSRQPIPYLQGGNPGNWHQQHTYYRQVGMYAYRRDILAKITQLPVSSLERAESLEQLRWLQAGYRIACVPTRYVSYCIDHPDDISRVLTLLAQQPGAVVRKK